MKNEIYCARKMEKLISHLQQTLDEDEAAKEALLLLRSHGSAENANIQTTAVNLPSIDVRLFDEVFDSRSSMFILQSITSKIIEDSITNLDLPVKVAAMQLQIPPKLLLEICFIENTSTPWPHNFVSCFWRVLEVCKSSIDRGMLFFSLEQFRKLQELFTEVERIRSGPRGAVAQFILGTIIAYADAQARPLILEQDVHLPSTLDIRAVAPPLATKELCYTDLVLHSYDSSARAIMLAPLTIKPRSPKHFIVPLMEPDLQRGAHIEFPPRVVALVRSREGEYERDVLQDEEFDVDDVFSTSVL